MSKRTNRLIPLEKAQKIIHAHAPQLKKVRVPLEAALGCVLAEEVYSAVDVPNVDTSMMDGYAVSLPAKAPRWRLKKEPVKAGDLSIPPLKIGEAVPIFTGAPIPHGAAAVVPLEEGVVKGAILSSKSLPKIGRYIRRAGADLKKGERVLAEGSVLLAAGMGLLASAGITQVPIYQKPRVALLTTGDELVPPGKRLKKGQAYESNSMSLMAAIKGMGLEAIPLDHAGDDPEAMAAAIKKGMTRCDCLIVTGGASVGKYDFTQRVFKSLGVTVHFEKSAIKPGKPTLFGTKGKKLFFGLAGNPVAALVTFELYVRPALCRMMGLTCFQPRYQGVLKTDIQRERDRLHLVRGKVGYRGGKFYVEPIGEQTSSQLKGLAEAQCLILIPPGSGRAAKGDAVEFQLLSLPFS